MDLEILTTSAQENKKAHFCKRCHVLTKLNWDSVTWGTMLNLYTHYDDDEKQKDAQAPT